MAEVRTCRPCNANHVNTSLVALFKAAQFYLLYIQGGAIISGLDEAGPMSREASTERAPVVLY